MNSRRKRSSCKPLQVNYFSTGNVALRYLVQEAEVDQEPYPDSSESIFRLEGDHGSVVTSYIKLESRLQLQTTESNVPKAEDVPFSTIQATAILRRI